MLIMSWNVAGLSTTVNRIYETYGGSYEYNNNNDSSNNDNDNDSNNQSNQIPKMSDNNSDSNDCTTCSTNTNTDTNTSTCANTNNSIKNNNQKKKKPSLVLSEYLQRHGADIFCVQEHKIPLSQLSSRSEPLGCSNIEGYESFWSCCVDPSKRGLNGVVTFVKKGLVCSAKSKAILNSPDLDDQGRCVMTDHGKFVLFNVYVPASSGQPLSYKMKFLNALRAAMKEQRERHCKQVILVGDLNISHTALDRYWSDRVLFVNDIISQHQQLKDKFKKNGQSIPSTLYSVPKWKLDLAEAWPKILKALETKTIVPTQTTNPRTNQKFDKFRLQVQVDDKPIFLGSHESDPAYCEYSYDFRSWSYTCADTDEEILAEEENVVCISTIGELMSKIVGIQWDEKMLRKISKEAGSTSRTMPPRKWLTALIEDDQMVDAFRYFYPSAEGRYTCWNQFTNRRYTNEGARIDYTLVDKSLLPYVLQGGSNSEPASSALRSCSSKFNPNSEEAALCAAVANGGFQPASFEGGGIMEATMGALDTQFGPPHTDPDTRKTQPHKTQKTISSFFTVPTAETAQPKRNVSVAPTVIQSTTLNMSSKKSTKLKPKPTNGRNNPPPKRQKIVNFFSTKPKCENPETCKAHETKEVSESNKTKRNVNKSTSAGGIANFFERKK